MLGLRVVGTGTLVSTCRELLLVSLKGERRTIKVEERAIVMPKIDLILSEFYTLGDMTQDGTQMTASLPYIWQGERRHLLGVVGFISGGALLVVPLGFFRGRLN